MIGTNIAERQKAARLAQIELEKEMLKNPHAWEGSMMFGGD